MHASSRQSTHVFRVPNKKRLSEVKRAPSDTTRSLYKARAQKFSAIAAQGVTVSKTLRKKWNRKIRDANLQDYNAWLETETMTNS